jgi:hypothetical protein
MVYCKEPQETKITIKRSNCFSEKITIGVKGLENFYSIVKILNKEIGHGNWTTHGRPVRKLKRVDAFNRCCSKLAHNKLRKLDIVFYVPKNTESIQTRLFLEMG